MTVLSPGDAAQTVQSIADVQASDGRIPWFPGGRTDPWDHVEAAMALDSGGHAGAARAAYEWLRRVQNPDGSWYRGYEGDRVLEPVREANFSAYLAVGLLHHRLTTGDESFVDEMWPTLVRALDFVLGLQAPDGTIEWAPGGEEALLTGCSSMFHSLRCALELARLRDEPQPDWELAAGRLAHVVACHPEAFADKSRFSMDWYYPVLGGSVRGLDATAWLAAGWPDFVVPGLGVRCVRDEPWVTGAETCELVMALDATGDQRRALEMFAEVQFLRDPDGAYWTGWQFANKKHFPNERSSYTSAAVILAADALSRSTGGNSLFRAAGAGTARPAPDPGHCG